MPFKRNRKVSLLGGISKFESMLQATLTYISVHRGGAVQPARWQFTAPFLGVVLERLLPLGAFREKEHPIPSPSLMPQPPSFSRVRE